MNKHFTERVCCPVCKTKDLSRRYELPYESEEVSNYLNNFYNQQGFIELDYLKKVNFILEECLSCNLIFQKFIPDDFLMYKLYEEWIDPNFAKENSFKHDLAYHTRYAFEIIDLIKFFKKDPNELSFLDFGMGWGKWSLLAKGFGVNSLGAELSETRIEFASKNGIDIVEWDEIPNHKFDFINTEQVFEHIPDPLETLIHLSKALNKNGLIKISVPNAIDIDKRLSNINWKAKRLDADSIHLFSPLEHLNCYNTKSIINLANKAGLINVENVRNNWNEPRIKDLIKDKLRPIYSKFKKYENIDTSLFFKKK